MRTFKLLTITALVGILSVSTLNAKEHHDRSIVKVKYEQQYQENRQDSRVKKDVAIKDKRASKANTNSRYYQTSPNKGFQKKLHSKKKFHSKKYAVKVLKRGDRGQKVKVLQRSLKQRGFYRGRVDGVFGKGLKRAVKKFQRNHRIYPNGVASKKTLRLLHLI